MRYRAKSCGDRVILKGRRVPSPGFPRITLEGQVINMEKQPYDPFEFAEEKVDKEFRKGFVMDTGMESGFPPPPPVKPKEEPKPKPKKKLNIKKKVRKAIKDKLDEMS